MPESLKYKPDWAEARERLAAFWEQRPIGRPFIAVEAPRGRMPPLPEPPTQEDRYLNPDYVLRRMLARFEATYYGGEAVPTDVGMGGWALAWGAPVEFRPETIWFLPVITGWADNGGLKLGDRTEAHEKVERLMDRLLDASVGRFVVGCPAILPANDMLALLRGTQDYLIELTEHAEEIRSTLVNAARDRLRTHEWIEGLLRSRTEGYAFGYPGLWGPRRFICTQSDVSCMMSPGFYEQFVLPELDLYGRACGRMWYHLDGPGAVVHLPRLLRLPYVRVIQYVAGAGKPPNGPHYMDMYRKIQAAGKAVEIDLPLKHAEAVARELDPTLLFLRVRAGSVAEAEELLARARAWA